jgi:hypothetical protein
MSNDQGRKAAQPQIEPLQHNHERQKKPETSISIPAAGHPPTDDPDSHTSKLEGESDFSFRPE